MKRKKKTLSPAQKSAQERNWLRLRIYGMITIFSSKNIWLLKSMLMKKDHYLVDYLVENITNLIAALENK